ERYTGWARNVPSRAIALPVTLVLVLIGWVMFRAANVGDAFTVYGGMIGLNGITPSIEFLANVTRENLLFLVLAIFAVFAEPYFKKLTDAENGIEAHGFSVSPNGTAVAIPSLAYPIAMSLLLVVTVARLSEQSVSPFLYFQF
ncbi:membrane bound O-acyl transferase MBOAT family protein, partial [Rhizobium sp. PDO1-076]